MLEGLEISRVSFSEVATNKDERIDSDFWTKKLKKNPKLNYVKIGDCLVTSQYGISIEMNEDDCGYPIYRMNEIHNMLCDFDVNKHADISASEMQTFKLNDKDVLFNRTNSYEWVGRTGIYRKIDERDFVFASYLVRFVPDQAKLLPEYLATFLSTEYGISDIKRRSRQSINQTNVNPEEVKEIEIPLLGLSFQRKLKTNFDKAYECLKTSETLYAQAEQTLLEAVGLVNFKPSTQNTNIKTFAQSFGISGRLDAEYYQPKYEDYLKLIFNYKNGWAKLSVICTLKDANFNPSDEVEYQYIELSDIDKSGGITGCTKDVGGNLPSRARRIVTVGDVVVSSIEGSLSSCALVSKEYNNALCSTGFYVIKSQEVSSETLLVLMKSELIQSILKQNCSGTILTALNKSEFSDLPIPKIDPTTQTNISQLVQQSFSLKTQSEHLLNVAKRAVEIAIEQDEAAAMHFIENSQ